jgi:ABC-type long-subunit fatty acid transport system fused permease/ATPase subunit
MSEETQSVRITQHMIYQKQLEMNDTQIQMLQKLENLEGVPDRIREVELELARLAWIEKIAYTALSAGVVAIIGLLINTIGK